MESAVIKRSIVVGGRKTSVSLEDAFWHGLKEIVKCNKISLSELVADIDAHRPNLNLSSAIRLFVLNHFRMLANSPDPLAACMEVPRSRQNGRDLSS